MTFLIGAPALLIVVYAILNEGFAGWAWGLAFVALIALFVLHAIVSVVAFLRMEPNG